MDSDEKKPLNVSGGEVVWRVRALPRGQEGRVLLRLEADSDAAREMLADLDVYGHKPIAVVDRARTVERCPRTGAFHTVGVTLALSL